MFVQQQLFMYDNLSLELTKWKPSTACKQLILCNATAETNIGASSGSCKKRQALLVLFDSAVISV